MAFASLETPREKIAFTLNSRQLVYIANYKATHADQSALQKNLNQRADQIKHRHKYDLISKSAHFLNKIITQTAMHMHKLQ